MSALIAFGATVAMAQTSGTRALGPLSSEEGHRAPCRATGTICFLGIDPDIYHMPLYGEYIQSGDRLICATRNWSSFPPEAFSIDFLRHFSTQMTSQDQAATEATAFFFITTHWGPPTAPAADLSFVATPAHFPDEVFRFLERRTFRIEFEVPKTDFEKQSIVGVQSETIQSANRKVNDFITRWVRSERIRFGE